MMKKDMPPLGVWEDNDQGHLYILIDIASDRDSSKYVAVYTLILHDNDTLFLDLKTFMSQARFVENIDAFLERTEKIAKRIR